MANTRLAIRDLSIAEKPTPKAFTFKYPKRGIVVHVTDCIDPEQDNSHFGLMFDISSSQFGVNQICQVGESIAFELMALLSFISQCYISRPTLLTAYQQHEEKPTSLEAVTLYVIDVRNLIPECRLKFIDVARLELVNNAVQRVLDDENNQLLLSMKWHWHALEAKDPKDFYLSLWTAIEILEPRLKELYEIPSSVTENAKCWTCNKSDQNTCNKCNAILTYKHETGFDGWKTVANRFGNGKKLFGKLHSLRSKIIHSGKIPDNLQENIEIAYKMYYVGALLLLGIDAEGDTELASVRFKTLPVRLKFAGTANTSGVIGIEESSRQPWATGEYTYEMTRNKSGVLEPNITASHTLHGDINNLKAMKIVQIDKGVNIKEIFEYGDQDTE